MQTLQVSDDNNEAARRDTITYTVKCFDVNEEFLMLGKSDELAPRDNRISYIEVYHLSTGQIVIGVNSVEHFIIIQMSWT